MPKKKQIIGRKEPNNSLKTTIGKLLLHCKMRTAFRKKYASGIYSSLLQMPFKHIAMKKSIPSETLKQLFVFFISVTYAFQTLCHVF